MTRVPRKGQGWLEAAVEPVVEVEVDPADVEEGEAEAGLVVAPGAKISHLPKLIHFIVSVWY